MQVASLVALAATDGAVNASRARARAQKTVATLGSTKVSRLPVTRVWHDPFVPIRSRVLIHPAPSGAPASAGSEGS